MVHKKLAIHAFWIFAAASTFYVSGCLGLFCESIHSDLMVSSTVFSVAFASIISFFTLVYNEIFAYLFG